MKAKSLIQLSLMFAGGAFCSLSHAFITELSSLKALAIERNFSQSGKRLEPLADWGSPLNGADEINATVTSCYGPRKLLGKFYDFHEGVDYGAKSNTPVSAVADGKIIWIGNVGCSGQAVVIRHHLSNKTVVFSVYKHLTRFRVHVGQQVKRGEIVALSGSSGIKLSRDQSASKRGCVLGPHLHVEFKILRPDLSERAVHDILVKTHGHMADTVLPVAPGRFLRGLSDRCS